MILTEVCTMALVDIVQTKPLILHRATLASARLVHLAKGIQRQKSCDFVNIG